MSTILGLCNLDTLTNSSQPQYEHNIKSIVTTHHQGNCAPHLPNSQLPVGPPSHSGSTLFVHQLFSTYAALQTDSSQLRYEHNIEGVHQGNCTPHLPNNSELPKGLPPSHSRGMLFICQLFLTYAPLQTDLSQLRHNHLQCK